jgi:hypothetical protein
MRLDLDEKLIRRFDVTTAVVVAIADASDLWPVRINNFLEVFPYLDQRTLRNRFDALAKEGILQKITERNDRNVLCVCYQK